METSIFDASIPGPRIAATCEMRGVVEPYLITDPTVSAYVPYAMLKPYVNMPGHQHASGQFTQPALQASPAANTTVEIYRIFDGKLPGMHLLEHMEPAGAISPWVGPRAAKGQ